MLGNTLKLSDAARALFAVDDEMQRIRQEVLALDDDIERLNKERGGLMKTYCTLTAIRSRIVTLACE